MVEKVIEVKEGMMMVEGEVVVDAKSEESER